MLELPFKLVLASQSPRRQQLMQQMGLPFEIKVKPIDETPPAHLPHREVAAYLAQEKAEVFRSELQANELIITSDTTVLCDNVLLGKPESEEEALRMLRQLSGKEHEVITAVCLLTAHKTVVFSDITKVFFRKLSEEEILFYIRHYKPYDKAGSYGAQDWIGLTAIERIEGSYFTVMGLPTHRLYAELKGFK
jgi:septum formation protein